jgi:hypothetical protein
MDRSDCESSGMLGDVPEAFRRYWGLDPLEVPQDCQARARTGLPRLAGCTVIGARNGTAENRWSTTRRLFLWCCGDAIVYQF